MRPKKTLVHTRTCLYLYGCVCKHPYDNNGVELAISAKLPAPILLSDIGINLQSMYLTKQVYIRPSHSGVVMDMVVFLFIQNV